MTSGYFKSTDKEGMLDKECFDYVVTVLFL